MDLEKEIKALTGGGIDREAQGKIIEKLFWGDSPSEDGLVPSVDPTDLKNVWNMGREVQTHSPGQQVAVDRKIFQSVCGPNADATVVAYRAFILGMVERHGLLSRWQHNGQLDDVIFELAAKFPIKRMSMGVPQRGLPLDVQEFVKQLERDV